jgi:Bardet-Biedl syndrome 2 protein
MSSQTEGALVIRTDDMELAGELVQDLCAYVGIKELQSVADFPQEMEAFRAGLVQV